MALLVFTSLHMDNPIKSIDCLCGELSLAQAGKRSQGIKACRDLADAPRVNGCRTAAVTGEEGLQ